MLPDEPRALTVGAITDARALQDTFSNNDCDIIELRLDALTDAFLTIEFCKRHQGTTPLLLTPRCREEGGQRDWSIQQRSELLQTLLPYAAAIDIELVHSTHFAGLIAEARSHNIAVVLSNHDFNGFDHVTTMERLAASQRLGATIAKAAVTLHDALDLTHFQSLVTALSGQAISLMGMGNYGPVSRLLAAQHGSRLNYGYLGGQATAPGQWPAPLLKAALAHTPALD